MSKSSPSQPGGRETASARFLARRRAARETGIASPPDPDSFEAPAFRPAGRSGGLLRRLLAATLPVGLAVVMAVLPAAPAAADPDHPSEQQVEESQETVRERAAAVEDIRAELTAARARMEKLSAKAQRLAEKYYREQVALERARQQYQEAKQRLAEATRAVRQARDRVATIAVQRYRTGSGLRRLGAMLDADGPQDLVDRMNALQILTRERAATVDHVRASEIVADVLRQQAHQALDQQRESTRQVKKAKQAAQKAAERQRAEVQHIQELQAKLKRKLGDAQARADRLERKREEYLQWRRKQQAREAREAQQGGDAGQAEETAAQQATEEVADITGRTDCDDKPVSLEGYANGLIPPQALCPLPQNGHMLRADAAAAFVRLNAAYAEAFGEPICITDSYRSLAVQQRLAQEKPELAAEPGTSRHGLGIAVDLCGGINSYGTVTHEWMRAHASDYGWILPSWARATGSMPEPWHWQYVG